MLNSGFLRNLEQGIGLNFAGQSLGNVVSTLLRYLFPLAGLAIMIYLVYGGYTLMTSGGNPQKLEQGKQIITNALIGFAIMFVSYWIVQVMGIMLGLGAVNRTF